MPNFIIFGAMKSGTSSIYIYLKQHPDIFMSPVKEPGFFAFEGEKTIEGPGVQEWFDRNIVKDLESYQKLFTEHQQEKAIGEASPFYIYYEKAAENIKKYLPDVKLIAILRNPADRAFSNYVYALSSGGENLSNFQDALAAESERINKNWVPKWHYKNAGFYYRQLKPYYERFDREQIKICLYENFVSNPNLFMQDIFKFLEVDSSFTPDMSRKYNRSLVPRNQLLNKFLIESNPVKSAIKYFLPSKLSQKLKRKAFKKNLHKPELQPKIRQQLMTEYQEDIFKLQQLTHQDFSSWLL